MPRYVLEIVVFISGAVVMIFELVGSRIMAPYLGTSLIVWTSLIGVILGSLSLGYFGGGLLADKNPRRQVLSAMLLLSAVLIALLAVVKDYVLNLIYFNINDLRISGFITAVILFAPASVLLGMVSPYAIRLKINNIISSGAIVGRMYAVSTTGSIVGTFLAGFFLIPFWGTNKTIWFLVLALIVSSFLIYFQKIDKKNKKEVAMLVFLIAALGIFSAQSAATQNYFLDFETLYNSIRIYDTTDPATDRPIRGMTTDPYAIQGAVFLDKDDDLVFDYLKFFRLSRYFQPNINTALFIGGGVYAYPKEFLRQSDTGTMDVIELDPGVTALAKKYFNFPEDKRIKIQHEDGRTFLNKNNKQYDCIFIDAFNSHLSIPFQLTTEEAVKRIHASLSADGVVLVNIISAVTGAKSEFLQAEVATYKSIFPQVLIFPVRDAIQAETLQNIILIALKKDELFSLASQDEEINNYLQHFRRSETVSNIPVLTDDFAPVDYYASKMY